MPIAFLIASVLAFFTSLLQFNRSESLLAWKLSILGTEFAHWIALLTLLFAVAAFRSASMKSRIAGVLFSAATILLFIPTFELMANFGDWSKDVARAFSAPPASLNVFGLYTGKYHVPATGVQTIKFWQQDNDSLTFDYYPPATTKSAKPAPWLLVVHGGGWNSGDGKQLPELNSYLASIGIAVISIDYRLAPKFPWPAQREDVWNAVSYVRSRAQELGLDPDRWAILGRSAGGQIAQRVAFGEPEQGNPRPLGLVSFYAPSDMQFAYDNGRDDDILESRILVRDYMGGTPKEKSENYHDSTTLFFISKNSSPTLLIHGPHDPLVYYGHSERVYAKLKAAGVSACLLTLPWATHGFDFNISGPGSLISTSATESFLRKVLL